eukprot:6094753-Amphidinium_carterae.1
MRCCSECVELISTSIQRASQKFQYSGEGLGAWQPKFRSIKGVSKFRDAFEDLRHCPPGSTPQFELWQQQEPRDEHWDS